MTTADVLRFVGMALQASAVAIGLILLRLVIRASRWMQSTDDKIGEQARQITDHKADWRAHRR